MKKVKTVRLNGANASNFMASMMVDDLGEKALDKCAKGSPIYKAVEKEISRRKELSK